MLSGALGRGCKKIGMVVCECECVMVEEEVAGVDARSTCLRAASTASDLS